MATIEQIVESISIEDLEDKHVCYRCVAAGMPIADSLYNPEEMPESPMTGDKICLHCHDVEIYSGYHRMGKRESARVWGLIKEFEKLKELRLKAYYNSEIS
ncbi:hypothetical protein JW756_05195 [Candidatus Woesearchaeota archaeon]|nr:hypothetical protein [Candidatus Woesearchaeota archaeon]